jgi:hypothetical protein
MKPNEVAPPRPRLPGQVQHALAALGYLALSLVYLRPIGRVFRTHIAPDPADPWFNLTVIEWGIRQMRMGLADFWNLPIFFPAPAVTTYSDHLIGPAALGALFTAVFPNAIAFYNLLFLGSFVLCGWSTWYILRQFGTGAAAAFLGGCMFAFSPIRWDQLSHLQILLMGFLPLMLWSWDRLLTVPGWWRAAVFLAFYALHVTGGAQVAYMSHFCLAAIAVVRVSESLSAEQLWSALKILIPTGAVCGWLMATLFLPYLQESRHRTRPVSEIRHYSGTLSGYVTPATVSLYTTPWVEKHLRRAESTLFAGILPTLLVVGAALGGWRRRRQAPLRPLSTRQKLLLALLALLTLAALVRADLGTWDHWNRWVANLPPEDFDYDLPALGLALGLVALALRRRWGGNWPLRLADLPVWECGLLASGITCFFLSLPIVYLPLMRWVPGMDGIRTPARFAALVSLTVAWFAARELDRLLRRPGVSRTARLALTAAAGLFLIAEMTPKALSWYRTPLPDDLAPVYRWLARQDDVNALLELPFGGINTEIAYMAHQRGHWKPLVNGYSGYLPDHYMKLRGACCWPVPDPAQLELLRGWGVTHILLHASALQEEQSWQNLDAFEKREKAEIVFDDGADRVYRIQGPMSRPSPR